jgi:hypothetical protein
MRDAPAMRRHTIPPELLTGPFTPAQAATFGVTDDHLRGASYRMIARGVWVNAAVEDSRELRFAAMRLLLPDRGVNCGWTAAWLHGADVRRIDDLDVHVGFAEGKRVRSRPGLQVCQETLDPQDIIEIDGVRLTTPLRTVFDCLRWLKGADRLVVADALTHAELVDLADLRAYFAGKRRLRNLRRGEALLDQVEPETESPMETRLRVLLVDAGLPRPTPQWTVRDRVGAFCGRLDLAYPEIRLGVEYDGADHWKQRREDDRRRDRIRSVDWEILVFSSDDVFLTPAATIAAVAAALRTRAA